jgi:ParB-like chromosome segregation protein Spo0J
VSLAIGPDSEVAHGHRITDLLISRIQGAVEARTGGLDQGHVTTLMETARQWPPIVVWGKECRLVDGAHRVEAARRLGHKRISAIRFVGSADEAFVEAVHRNIAHGLPLKVADRKRAAIRVLTSHRDWSDSRIGYVCGLSGKTVARLRREGSQADPGQDVPIVHAHRRIGLDGKARPARAGDTQDRIRLALLDNPGATLRAIATVAGASPETVRTVRLRLASEPYADTLPTAGTTESAAQTVGPVPAIDTLAADKGSSADGAAGVTSSDWDRDPALLACEDGGEFARWFADHDVDDEWYRFISVIPLSRIYRIVDEARRRAAAWTSFASMLESRVR